MWLAFAVLTALEWEHDAEQELAEPTIVEEVELSPGGIQLRGMVVRATGYSFESCSANPCRTRTGTTPRVGTVAVDPRIIPLGTRMLIHHPLFEGIEFQALDTGGGVRGDHIDIFFGSTREAINWGSRTVQITLLD